MTVDLPQTHYATAEKNVHVAYQVFGGGPHDLVFVPPFVSNVDVWWDLPIAARFFNRLASFARVILLDKRGTGLSDRLSTVETPEERMDDIRAVMDDVGSKKAAIFAASESVPIALIFAATYPDRTTALLLQGGMARWSPAPDYPWSLTDDMYTSIVELSSSQWGTGFSASLVYPSAADGPGIRDWFAHYERVSASPGGFATITLNNTSLDVRAILPYIQARTLLVHAASDTFVHVGGSRYLASQIPGAKYVEPPGRDHLFCGENGDLLTEEIEEFLTGMRHEPETDRVLATVLFTDIVSSTARAAALGDRAWKDLLTLHDGAVRRQVERFRGRVVKSTGDGFLGTFDGPARAVRCAAALINDMRQLGLGLRAGVHTGEIKLVGDDIAGIAVHVASRVCSMASSDEVLVSSTVRDLVAGSGLAFEERGKFSLADDSSELNVLVVRDHQRDSARKPKLDLAREAFEAAVERAVGGTSAGPRVPLSKG